MTELLDGLRWRLVGPFRGGRVVAVAGHPQERLTFWFGSTGGGVWKTADGGATWRNVSDGFFRRASVGALVVANSDPNVLYAGMGESCIRNTVSHGDGVYRSENGGRTWEHCGLEATRHIGRIRVDPHDPRRVYVAALGHAHGPNPERGVYRSRDGGRTWDLLLHRGDDAGAVDLALDPHQPRTVYATTWQARRHAWRLDSGGEGSGIWRSDDGGDSWSELSRKPGMPGGPHGRIGIAPSPAKPGRIWAIVEARDGGVFRSDDRGEHWVRLSQQRGLRQRPFYYSHIHADPRDPETVWALNVFCWRSLDGGATFTTFPVQHGDCHDLWIDPQDTQRLILGDDGGASVSFDGGASWSTLFNQPTAELYRIAVDTRTPYNVYATQQDNTTVRVPTWSRLGAITYFECGEVGGGESGGVAVRPDDPDVVYAGNVQGYLTRWQQRDEQLQLITAQPESAATASELPYRFNWTAPLVLSPHDPDVLYHGANRVLRSTDEGMTWQAISPDLTRNDPARTRGAGGPITADATGAEYYCTLSALAESPLRPGVLWAGSDDGLVHVSEDGGVSWREVTPPGVPEWAAVPCIEPSPHDACIAHVAVDNHRADDFTPYLFRTRDLGATWERVDAGMPRDVFCRVVREDPRQPGLLFSGTETGVHVSLDDAASWHRLGGALPAVPVHDMLVNGDDLVVATHGRAIWILDDLVALRQQAALAQQAPGALRLFAPRPLVRWPVHRYEEQETAERGLRVLGYWVMPYTRVRRPDSDDVAQVPLTGGENAERGVAVLYLLDGSVTGEVRITVSDADGGELRCVTVPARAGLNRWVWDTRPEPAGGGENPAPEVPPGHYRVRVAAGDVHAEAPFTIAADPRNPATQDDHERCHALAVRIWQATSRLNDTLDELRRLRTRLGSWSDAEPAVQPIIDALTALEGEMTPGDDVSSLQITLDHRLASIATLLTRMVRATESARAVVEKREAEVAAVRERFEALLHEDIVVELDRRIGMPATKETTQA